MGFLPLAGEVDLRPLLQQAIDAGNTVCVPVAAADGSMVPARLMSLEPSGLQQDAMGVTIPRRIDPVPIESLQVVLVPGLAFDASGHRLGRGGGFYDRFLPRLGSGPAAVGVGFACQLVSRVPVEPQDARVAWLALSSGVVAAQPIAPI
jgi:5-formyltetrahydrofolate cyclo-ligase